jgi:hypothetical protein
VAGSQDINNIFILLQPAPACSSWTGIKPFSGFQDSGYQVQTFSLNQPERALGLCLSDLNHEWTLIHTNIRKTRALIFAFI